MFQKSIPVLAWNPIPYWEFEEYIKRLNDRNKEEAKREKEQSDEQGANTPDMGKLANQYSKTPKFNTPSFKTPSYLK